MIPQDVNQFKKGGKFAGIFPERWLPASIGIIEPLTEKNKMINSTMKMVRGKITEHYKDRIEYLYTPESKNIINDKNKQVFLELLK
jgi:long-chain acyl-CoA synthetase